jgi:hypothetical protein
MLTGMGTWSDFRVKRASSDVIRSLDNVADYVIVLHLYIHFAQVHSAVYAQHWRAAARAVEDLIHRNPKVQ